MKKQLLFVLPLLLALASCNLFDTYGKKVEVGKSEVFYKGDGVTQNDAENLGQFLLKNKLFDSTKKSSAQLTKENNTYIVRLVMDAKTMAPSLKLNLWKLQTDLSNDVFNGATARIAFTDDHLNEQEMLPPVNKVKVGNTTVTFDSNEFSAQSMQEIPSALLQNGLLTSDKEADLFVRKEAGKPVVRIIVVKEAIQPMEETVMPVFGYWQHVIESQVPALQKSTFWLTTTNYEDYKKIPELTAAEVAQIENERAAENAPGSQAAAEATAEEPAAQ